MKLCLKCKKPFISTDWCCNQCSWRPDENSKFLIFAKDLLKTDNKFFDREAFSTLFKVENKHFWFRARNQLILWAIKKYFTNEKKILEIGCGTGYVISSIQKKFPHLELYAADIFEESLPFVQSRVGDGVHIFQMDGREIPYKEEFDLIGAFDVLEHIKEDECVIQEMYQALKKSGGVLLTVPQHPKLWSAADVATYHVRRYRTHELQDKLIKCGFKIVFSTSFVTLLLPLMALSRIRLKEKLSPETDVEFNTSKLVNSVLEMILCVERTFIKTGIHFPFGGSRLVVAKKQ